MARYRWRSRDGHEPWPDFEGQQVESAMRIASWLTLPGNEARGRELAEHCNEVAGRAWAALHRRIRDAPYMPPSRDADEHALAGNAHVRVVFRTSTSVDPAQQKRWDSFLGLLERALSKKQCPTCPKDGLARCAFHVDAAAHRDAQLASEIGERWAQFAWQTFSHIRTWPTFEDRCATVATALIA